MQYNGSSCANRPDTSVWNYTSRYLTIPFPSTAVCIVAVPLSPLILSNVYLTVNLLNGTSLSTCGFNGLYPSPVATPQFLRSFYGIPPGLSAQSGKATNAVIELYDTPCIEFLSSDIDVYGTEMGVFVNSTVSSVCFGNNGLPEIGVDLEASLDLQILTAMAPGATTMYININPYLSWTAITAYLVNMANLPQV